MDDGGEIEVRRRRLQRPWLLGVLGLLALLLLTLWLQRKPIASHYIEGELARRGVQARYEVERVGLRSERLANVVIGDPARPDLTARWLEIRLGWSLSGPKVEMIRGRGIRLEGRLVDGKLSLGQIDRLLPAPTGGPFRLPDQMVDIADAGMRLATPYGVLGIGIEGQGRVSDGFRGRLAVFSHRLASAGCAIDTLRANWAVSVDRHRPHLEGPVRAGHLACGTRFAAGRTDIALDAILEPALDGWRGGARIAANDVHAYGASSEHLAGTIGFAGSAPETRGRLDLNARRLRGQGTSAALVALAGPYSVSPADGRVTFAGAARTRGARLPDGVTAPIRTALAGLGPTPIGPVADRLAMALARAAAGGIDADADVHLALAKGKGALRLDRLDATARSGARLVLAGESGLELHWPSGAARIHGELLLSGGGFPEARFSLRQGRPGAPVEGVARVAPMATGDSRLALAPIHFAHSTAGTRIDTVATIDGPFSGGRVGGLVLPIRARLDGGGGFVLGEACTAVSFAALEAGTLRLGPTRLPLCPTGRALVWKGGRGGVDGGASVAGLRLSGTLGRSPLAIAAERFRFELGESGFAASGVAVRLGPGESVNRLDIAALTGKIGREGLNGRFAGLSGKLAAVPLRVAEGEGDWHLRGTDLAMNGALTLSDAVALPRFNPLVSRDFHLALAGNRIEAKGSLLEGRTGTHIADVRIGHDLASGHGRALLDLPGIRFDPAFQPEQLTRLTIGVIALVDGTLKGQGEIAWDGRGTTSSGTFSTENMNLAASFGPIEGLATSLHFTDLLNLVSAPGQVATTRAIHAGVDVFDGQLRYQILPGLRVGVEQGHWPFAGGDLMLEKTVLDFSQATPKRLVFRVDGMDIASFVQQMEFSNIAATGTVDGTVPMLFDERGGRIEGGHLVARPAGGTLSYVGELTDRELGAYGKLAFDALKSLRYSKLVIDLNGSLEGEFLAGIQLDGIARDVAASPTSKGGISAMVVGRALGQLAKIPFKFNIQVKGPFRALIGTARSFNDPTNLIQSVLPEMLRGKSTTTTVQPNESEPVR